MLQLSFIIYKQYNVRCLLGMGESSYKTKSTLLKYIACVTFTPVI